MEEEASLHPAGSTVEDSMLEGLGGGAAPGAERWQVLVEPGGLGSKIALASPHLMDVAGKKFGEAHECLGGEGGAVSVSWGWGSKGGPLPQEDSCGLILEGDEGVGGRVRFG